MQMPKSVLFFEGPVGVGKTSLGREVASRLGFRFIDGDDYATRGNWLRSILTASHRIVDACQEQLENHPAVIVAYPLRCTNWVFYRETFKRRDISFHCIGLTADVAHIAKRERNLSEDEIARSAEMIAQGYGQRHFSDLTLRTDESDFEDTCNRLMRAVQSVLKREKDRGEAG